MARKLICDYDSTVSDLIQAVIDVAWETGWQKKTMPFYPYGDGKITPKILDSWGLYPLFKTDKQFKDWFRCHNEEVLMRARPFRNADWFLRELECICRLEGWQFIFFSSVMTPDDYIYKYERCKQQFGDHFADLLKVGRKKTDLFKAGDIVIDDYPKNLGIAHQVGAYPVCIKRPHNSKISRPAWTGYRYTYSRAIRRIDAIAREVRRP